MAIASTELGLPPEHLRLSDLEVEDGWDGGVEYLAIVDACMLPTDCTDQRYSLELSYQRRDGVWRRLSGPAQLKRLPL